MRNRPSQLKGTSAAKCLRSVLPELRGQLTAETSSWQYPAQLLRLPSSFLRSWPRGHFDGDGCVAAPAKVPKVSIRAEIPEMNQLVRSVCQRIGFPTTNGQAANIEISGWDNVLHFIDQVGSFHPKKRRRMDAWRKQGASERKDRTDAIPVGRYLRQVRQQIGMKSHYFQGTWCSLISAYERNLIHPSRRRLRSLVSEMRDWAEEQGADPGLCLGLQTLVDAPILWSPVTSVTSDTPSGSVYDLVCEGPHTFIANGIVTHNCVVWLDEFEKALAHGDLDSGTSTRVFGSILTWMQEKKAPVFVMATANQISTLPPELLRKGRFDEIFFLDLPTVKERQEIFIVHLRKRNRLPQDFDTRSPGPGVGRLRRRRNRASRDRCDVRRLQCRA